LTTFFCAFALAITLSVQAQNVRVREIVVRGNKRISTRVITSLMKVKEGVGYNLAALDEDAASIRDLGWFSKVSWDRDVLSDGNLRITIDVAEFETVREVAILGNTSFKAEELLKLVTFLPTPGAKEEELRPYNQREAGPTGNAITQAYINKGLFGQVVKIRPSDNNPNTIEIVIQELIVNSVTIEGLTGTQDRVFNKLIRTKPGDAFNRLEWNRDGLRLLGTQWFQKVEPSGSSPNDLDAGLVDLKMVVSDARTGNFNVGIALDPQNSLAGLISYSDQNFRGTGQTVGLNYTQATQGQGGSVSFDYTNPFLDSKETILRASLYDRVQFRFANNGIGNIGGGNQGNQASERRTGGLLSYTRPIIRDKFSIGLTGKFERINVPLIAPIDPVIGNNFIQQDGEVASLAVTGLWNTRDLDSDPSRGKFTRVDIESGYSVIKPINGTAPPIGRFPFTRLGFDFRTYYSRDKRIRTAQDASREVIAFRLQAGTIIGDVPFFEQFFAGGNNSIRGYFEDRFWGTNRMVASLEYRKPVSGEFSIVGFVDYGSAWGGYTSLGGFEQTRAFSPRLGYGLGVRLRTGIGPIRLDYGFNGEGGSRPHFQIGTDF
jgi:outer membrane protein insertion porin family